MQFVFWGGLFQGWRRGWRASLPAAAIVGTAFLAFLLMNLNTLFYHLVNGDNVAAVVRNYQWMENYALKIVDMVVPPPDHRFPLFADWGANHLKEVILSPGELPMSGYIGLVGLAALGWLTVVSVRRVLDKAPIPLEALMILWIMLYASVGGINGLMGTLGLLLFRSTTRYTIVILAIVLLFAVKRLSEMKWKASPLPYLLAPLLVLLALGDQTPSYSEDNYQETSKEVASDRDFTAKMEKRLSPNAMVFQIPIMEFPESPAPGIGSYDHLRPYLYSHDLRYSFGSDKGRSHEKWQQDIAQLPIDQVISNLESYGFAALYVNRNGFQDRGQALITALNKAGRSEVIESDQQDLFCVILKPSTQPVLP